MRLRTKRQTPIGTMLQLEPFDESLHRPPKEAFEPKPQPEPVRGFRMVEIPGTKLRVCEAWAEAMGYQVSSGDGTEET